MARPSCHPSSSKSASFCEWTLPVAGPPWRGSRHNTLNGQTEEAIGDGDRLEPGDRHEVVIVDGGGNRCDLGAGGHGVHREPIQ